ncbi:MAG TPA: methyl-accepting chemotaxis protein, partial [Spirochaetota bacterium]|nr:methyl-accepting chemotaxis protein [Spirochaetota bacterium]
PPFSTTPETIFQQYNIAYTQIFVFFVSFLFTYRNYQLIMVYILGLSSILIFYFTVTSKIPLQDAALRANIFSATVLIHSFAFFLTFYINKIFIEIIRKAAFESQKNISKFEKLNNLVLSSKNGMEIGKRLVESSSKTVETINSMDAKITFIKNDMSFLNDKIEKSKKAGDDIINATKSLKAIVSEQNSVIASTNSNLREITNLINAVKETSKSKKEIVDKLLSTALSGEKEVDISLKSMENLSKNAEDILSILGVISNISERTNLLAMNAAIEAAHAGESGKGFSVVAGEIRKLAENTNTNTKMISQTLNKNSLDIKNAFIINKKVGEYFNKINLEIKDVSKSIEDILILINDLFVKMISIKNNSDKLEETSLASKTSTDKIESMNNENSAAVKSVNDFILQINKMFDNAVSAFSEIVEETNRISEVGELNIKYIENFSDRIREVNEE